MELENEIAKLIGIAKTDEQLRNALNAYEDTAWKLPPDKWEQINHMIIDAQKRITSQNNDFYGLCFAIRKEHGFHNAIVKTLPPPTESDGSQLVTDFGLPVFITNKTDSL
jgi:hypothetical protein